MLRFFDTRNWEFPHYAAFIAAIYYSMPSIWSIFLAYLVGVVLGSAIYQLSAWEKEG